MCVLQEEQEGVEIGAGEEVYVEHGGCVVSGKVTEISSQTQYEVAFEDGSVCSNLSTADLVVSIYYSHIILTPVHCEQDTPLSPPQQGSKLRVKWSDGQIYLTTVLGQHSAPLYSVSYGVCILYSNLSLSLGTDNR